MNQQDKIRWLKLNLLGWRVENVEGHEVWYNGQFRAPTDWNPYENIVDAIMLIENINWLQFSIARENCSGVRYDASCYNDYECETKVNCGVSRETMEEAITECVYKAMNGPISKSAMRRLEIMKDTD